MCRKARNFCLLFLYLATLLTSLISPSNYLVASLGFSMYSIISSANSKSCTSFPNWIPFILFFSSLIAVARNFKAILKDRSESGHSCLIPDLRLNTFNCLEECLLCACHI